MAVMAARVPGYCPTPRQEAWLQAALLPGEAGLAAWRAAAAGLEGDRLDGAIEALLPLVYLNLGVDALRDRYLLTWGRNQQLFQRVRPLVHALESAGIEAIVLKGLALVAGLSRDPGSRPMQDVDVLVPPAEAERAGRVATDLGWRAHHRLTAGFRRVKHAAPFEDDAGAVVDLHWRVFEEPAAPELDGEFRAAAVPVTFQGTRLRVPSATDQLLHVCGHAARWSEVPPIRWVADAVLILREGTIDWDRLVAHTVRRRFLLRMRRMLAYLRQALGAGIPPEVVTELAGRPVSMLERLEHRVRTRRHHVLGELPVYAFNCLRGERHPLLAFPGYLRDAWELESLADVLPHALSLASRRFAAARASRS